MVFIKVAIFDKNRQKITLWQLQKLREIDFTKPIEKLANDNYLFAPK